VDCGGGANCLGEIIALVGPEVRLLVYRVLTGLRCDCCLPFAVVAAALFPAHERRKLLRRHSQSDASVGTCHQRTVRICHSCPDELYFHNTSDEMQKVDTYRAASFQLLRASPLDPLELGGGTACSPNTCYFPPKPRVSG